MTALARVRPANGVSCPAGVSPLRPAPAAGPAGEPPDRPLLQVCASCPIRER